MESRLEEDTQLAGVQEMRVLNLLLMFVPKLLIHILIVYVATSATDCLSLW